MSLSMHQMFVPVTTRALSNLAAVLKKGQAWAADQQVDDAVMLGTRLIPNMLPLSKQVQIATDMAKNGAARLAGVEPIPFEDNETDFGQLLARLERAIEILTAFTPEQLEGSETRSVVLKLRSGELNFQGLDYVQNFVLPNVFFHCTTAYNILRQAGVPLGKMDFLGGV
ncbi:DUF1993 domain-containing protein [Oleiagrimonas sp. C23AA]|uniref:DUF1993 domain-containing protein n=1 Tax=Oleiagrimonas sp. C23AA TaxID=2719047 RepID=UPI001422F19E|nr:DUF1993 domain-containing protein [Oleiagrimonas sp. C23AA]NII12169.1 DUF1993 domain-containing protein [Oleiagrimonas sp. C23AA]